MRAPPRRRGAHLLDARALLAAIVQGGLALALLSGLLVALTAAGYGEDRVRTVVFSALLLANLGLIVSTCRWQIFTAVAPRRSNRPLWAVVTAALAAFAVVLGSAPVRRMFRLAAPSPPDLAMIALAGLVSLAVFQTVARVARPDGVRRSQPRSTLGETP